MISIDQAGLADEFHIAHAGLPCSVWTRSGPTHYGPGEGQFLIGVIGYDEAGYQMFCSITTVNAGDFHTVADCPHIRSDQSDRSQTSGPMLASDWRDSDGRDALSFDARGFDTDGFDRSGYDELGYDRAGRDDEGYDRAGYNRAGYNRDGFNQAGYDDEGYNAAGFDTDGCNRAGDYWCSDCESAPCQAPSCDRCEESIHDDDDLYTTLDESIVCTGCRERYYTWCEDCDGYYRDGNEDDHQHGGGDGCCDSPQMRFKVRNDGYAPLANDTRVTITLPAGIISAEGLSAIRSYLQKQGHYDLSYSATNLGEHWQTKQGNYTRRLSRLAYSVHQTKLTPEVLSQVGCIARDHSKQVGVEIEVSRALNENAGYWYHEGSCWWSDYSSSRCTLKTNGGFGMRSFDKGGYVSGRAWVMPLQQVTNTYGRVTMAPTFDTETPDAFVVFNGYGDLKGYTPARVLAHMAGWTYRKIRFECSPMYVNAGGYLIAPEDIAEPYTNGSLTLTVEQHSDLFQSERQSVNA